VVASGPEQTLKRGYAIARHARSRKIVRSIREIRDGLRLITQLADGEFRSTAEDPRQPSLFDEAPPDDTVMQ
jgi:exonuclease VII large subunit